MTSTITTKVDLIKRMYTDHGYTVEDIVLRLRYPLEFVEEVIKKLGLEHGKSWRC